MEYAVLIEGENCRTVFDGKTHTVGFLIWRCVDAVSPTEAELAALQMVRDLLADSAMNALDDPVRLKINETRSGYGDLTPPGTGFIFFEVDAPSLWRRIFGWLASVRTRKIR
jgi:hypothetical protein